MGSPTVHSQLSPSFWCLNYGRIVMIWLALSLLYPSYLFAQILTQSDELTIPTADTRQVKRIRGRPDGVVKVTWVGGDQALISPLALWGYRDRKGVLYRYYEGEFFEVYHQGNLMLYVQLEFGNPPKELFYFSRTPDGPVRYLDRRNVQATFFDSPCMMDVLSSIKRKSIQSQMQRLTDAYQYCVDHQQGIGLTK